MGELLSDRINDLNAQSNAWSPRLDAATVFLWERLESNFEKSVFTAYDVLGRVLSESVPGWEPGTAVELHHRDAAAAFERTLAGVEAELDLLSSKHEARTLFTVSRLCAALPAYRAVERSLAATQMRIRAADVWAIAHGRQEDNSVFSPSNFDPLSIGVTLRSLGDEVFADAIALHSLVGTHRRMVVQLTRTNYLRLYSATNRVPGPRVRFDGHGDVQVLGPHRQAEDAADLFGHRYSYNRAYSWFGFADPSGEEDGFVTAMKEVENLSEGPFGGGVVFAPDRFGLAGLAEIGSRFPALFDAASGMPAEHLVSLLMGISALAVGDTPVEHEAFKQWGMPIGIVPLPRECFLPGGRLEAMARDAMRQQFPGFSQQAASRDFSESVVRFSEFARPPVDESYAEDAGLKHPERALWLPYLVLGGEEDDVWLVDLAASIPFVQSLVDRFQVSEASRTTASRHHDAYERTSLFDLALWRGLGGVRGVKAALPGLRPDPRLPNIDVPLSDRGNKQELDVPIRIGDVLVAVQTWARDADKRIEEGDHGALEARWNSVRRKRSATDRNYAKKLIEDTEARRLLRSKNIRYVLPILCSPIAEPVASAERRYWLRHPSDLPLGQVPLALPRILTPPELRGFLETTKEEELRGICKEHGWKL